MKLVFLECKEVGDGYGKGPGNGHTTGLGRGDGQNYFITGNGWGDGQNGGEGAGGRGANIPTEKNGDGWLGGTFINGCFFE